jgi:hypothetical protein
MTKHRIGTHEGWQAARDELLPRGEGARAPQRRARPEAAVAPLGAC